MKNILVNLSLHVPYRYFKSVIRRFLFCFDSLFLHDVSPKNGVALIRLDAIGDFIVWLDSAKAYRGIYPSERIVLIANTSWAEFAMTLPYWDEVLPVDPLRFSRFGKYRFYCMKKISSYGFSVAIHPGYSRRTSLGDSIVRATQATHKIAPVRDRMNSVVPDRERKIADAWYSRIVPSPPDEIMELDRNTDFLNQMTGRRLFAPSLPKLPPSQRSHLDLGAYFIVVPGAGWQGRMWRIANFCSVILRVREKYGLRAVICGGSSEMTLCQRILDEVKGDAVNYAGKTSLLDLADLIAGARVVVTNETAAVHFATAVGTPSVCIIGGGHFGRFVPYPEKFSGVKPIVANFHMICYGCNWSCTEIYAYGNPVPCIDKISGNVVLDAIDQAIGQNESNL